MARFLPVWDGRVWLGLVHTVAAWDPHSFRRCDVAHRGRHAAQQGRYAEASFCSRRRSPVIPIGWTRSCGSGSPATSSVPPTRRSTSSSAPGSAPPARSRCGSFSASPTCARTSRAKADAHLTALVNLEPDRRLPAQAERTIKVYARSPSPRRCACSLLRRAAPGGAYAPGVAPPPVTSDAC